MELNNSYKHAYLVYNLHSVLYIFEDRQNCNPRTLNVFLFVFKQYLAITPLVDIIRHSKYSLKKNHKLEAKDNCIMSWLCDQDYKHNTFLNDSTIKCEWKEKYF